MVESLISTTEMSRILGKSVDAVRAMRRRNQLPDAIKIGTKVYWSETDVKRFFRKSKIERKEK